MLNIEAHELPFSFEQPDSVLSPLVALLQQALNDPHMRAARGKVFVNAYYVLIIDTQERRSQYIAQALTAMGYQPIITTTTLEAFRLFLQGKVIPFAIIVGQEDASNRLFLHRLVQQIIQKYGWEILLIRLFTQNLPQLGPVLTHGPRQQTGPLPPMTTGKLAGPQTPVPFNQQPSSPMQALQPFHPMPHTAPLQPADAFGRFSEFTHVQELVNGTSQHSRSLQRLESGERRFMERPKVEKVSLENHDMGRYHIDNLIGDGPLGSVYQAYDRLREQNLALKAVQTDNIPYYIMEGMMEEAHYFQLEEELLAKIAHPHILALMHVGKSYISGTPFIYKTMPLYSEGSLAQWLQNRPTKIFQAPEVGYLIVQMAETLQHIHNQNATFQNFKPSNFLLRSEAQDIRHLYLLLSDIAIPQDGSFFSEAPAALPYVAPERWQGQALPASDQYALAAFAYELLTGRPPFQGNTESIMKHLHQNMQPQPPSMHNPGLPSFVDKVLLRALSKRPEDRFSSISIFARTFQRYCL